jgi:hypothetical protein
LDGYTAKVVEMKGRRVSKLLVAASTTGPNASVD